MSCQIQVVAKINDLGDIRRCLFPTDNDRGSDSWLQNCEISVSPVSDLIVIANERKIVILTSKWNSNSSLNHFSLLNSGTIHDYDKVKAVLCLPIVEQNGSSITGPDWTCILIAFDSGFIRFYTENCQLLFEEQFHNENITNVKCQSQHGPRPDISLNLQPEEIYIQYQSSIVVINGVELFPYLKSCRSQLAKGGSVDLPPPKFNQKKWGFLDQSVINDSAVIGLNLSSGFDHLLTASTSGGFDTKYRAVPPHSTLVLAIGSKPFLGYHYALEGVAQPVLSDVAKVVAIKLKSALPTWLTGAKAQPDKQMTAAMQPPDNMGCRFGLCDLKRTATSVYLSPDHKLSAVCDTLGRVVVVDSFTGVVLKIFKGYRDAQCSFLLVPEEKKAKHKIGNKVAHFLTIYSPRKGTIEIFSVQQWNKIVTFTASKHSRLIYITYGLMGFMKTTKSKYVCQFNTVFIDNDGQVKEILVPFHFALSEKNSNRVRDLHIYKQLRRLIKSEEYDEEQLFTLAYNTCTELNTIEMKLQAIEMLITNKNVPMDVILKCVRYYKDNLEDEQSVSLKVLCGNVNSLLSFYVFINESIKNNENGNSESTKNTTMNLHIKELKNLQKLLDLSIMNDNNKSSQPHVSFSKTKRFSPAEFLSTFELDCADSISLNTKSDENCIFRTAEVIFKPYISGELKNFHELESELVNSKLTIRSLFDMLINYWVNRTLYINLELEVEMNNLSTLIYTLAKNADREILSTEYNSISVFWNDIRQVLANSGRPFPALIAALLCRHEAQKLDNELQMNDSSGTLEDNMEVLSQENVEWSILIGKLEDVSLLNIVLATAPAVVNSSLPKLHQNKTEISLKYVLEKGKGCVSELVAQWLTTSGISPQYIHQNLSHKVDDELSDEYSDEQNLLKQLKLIKEPFPYSMHPCMLLSNMAWEYAVAWHKEIGNLENLEAAIECLSYIENVHVKQGLFQLMWNTHLKILLESTCKLINKVGKLPKEILCRQDCGLSDYQISIFLSISSNFLDKFIDVTQQSYEAPVTTIHFENLWDNGGQHLVELAIQQKDVNFDLLHLHYQLVLVLQLIATFSIKHTKPVSSLFEASVMNLFFTDLQKKSEFNWNKSDVKINSSRIQFLNKIISASLETVPVNETGTTSLKEHVFWMSKCVDLGRFWNLNVDILRRFQIARLYCNGCDNFAQELIPAITDRYELGKQLLKIGINRLSQYLTMSPDLAKTIAAVSPTLTNYMKMNTEENEGWCSPSSLKALVLLASHTIHCLSEDKPEHKLALLLLDACYNLEDENDRC